MVRFTALGSVVILSLAACNAPPAEPASAPEPAPQQVDPGTPVAAANTLTPEGYGPLRVGMTRAEVEAALGGDSNPEAVGGPEPETCDVFHPARAPEGLNVMVENGRLSRITLMRASTVKTAGGLGLGSTAAQVKAAHPDAEVWPHKYVEGAEDITVWTGGSGSPTNRDDPGARGIRFETDASGVVTIIHAGGPSIRLVESCL